MPSEAGTQHALGRRRREAGGVAAPRVIGMRMRDDGSVDWLPRVDVEITGRAVQAFRPGDHEVLRLHVEKGSEGPSAQ